MTFRIASKTDTFLFSDKQPDGSTKTSPVVGALDSSFPYSTAYSTDGTTKTGSATASPGQHLIGMDTPNAGLPSFNGTDTPINLTRADRYSSYLMYTPGDPNANVWIPIARLPWNWQALANYNDVGSPQWTGDAAAAIPDTSTPDQTNSGFPTWTRNVRAAIFVKS